MLDDKIVEHCAPALAGLKTANMFNYRYLDDRMLRDEIDQENRLLNPKGLYVRILRMSGGTALLYVYRKSLLMRDLGCDISQMLLRSFGYPSNDRYNIGNDEWLRACLEHLSGRLAYSPCFPHEVGLFLGYPREDVLGFITQHGKNCKCCGMWKVYGDEKASRKLFDKFRKCTEIYRRIYAQGRTLSQLTVAA
ncbi:MAG: DUF3793 family protein [Lachnospiraceae bacterium]|nr:DUF3793 family protein [Lachnospiraceae bacterium]